MRDTLLSLLFQDFPESFLMTLVCFSFLRLRWRWRQILVVTALLTLTNLVRLLPIAFGVHSVIIVALLGIYLYLVTGVQLSRTFSAALLCILIMVVTQTLYILPLLKLIGKTYEEIAKDPFMRSLFSLPTFIVLFVVAMAKQRYNYYHRNFVS
ncbi:MAG: hypothetical protein ACYC0Q_13440 [Eubacteriales bacterium]